MELSQLLNTNMAITKYMQASIVDTIDEYSKSSEIKSVIAI
jgi:hypothetical protein